MGRIQSRATAGVFSLATCCSGACFVTAKTRRRVFLSLVLVALTLPAEVILLKALQQPDDTAAVQEWVGRLESAELSAASERIQSYPFKYRKEIMRALSPERRAAVWQRHLEQYIQQHPELDGSVISSLKAAQSSLTPQALSDPTADMQASLQASAEQLEALLGKEQALYLAHDLGPRERTFASIEPLSMKLATFVRDRFAAFAQDDPDCDCADDYGCGYYTSHCDGSEDCEADRTFPMCGYWWNQVCDGMCATGEG